MLKVASVEDIAVRFATTSDSEFLIGNAYISPEVVRRKIELHEFIVAVDKSRLLGFLQIEYLWSKVPYIALIRVLPEHRRRGIGRELLGWLENLLREKGHRLLYSSSQADEPEPQAWHRHVGFRECGIIKEINDGIDEIFFCKSLSEE